MRKKLYSLLNFILLFGLCGCAGGEAAAVQNADAYTEVKDYIVVGYSQVGSESDYRIANTQSFMDTFTKEKGYYLLFDDAQNKQENQLKTVRSFILQEVDYIILDPVVETGWESILQEARDAGIPVILSDRSVELEDDSLYTCWVGSNFQEEGENAGKWLADYLKQQGMEDTVNIVALQGTLGSTAQIGRTKGFEAVCRQHPEWNLLESRPADFTQAKGKEVMEDFLRLYEDIDVVISENDNMTFGAIDAIEQVGKTCGPDGDICIISFDAVQAALIAMQGLKDVKEGSINADFECNPLLAPKVEEVIRRLEKGEQVEKMQYIDETYYDSSMDLSKVIDQERNGNENGEF